MKELEIEFPINYDLLKEKTLPDALIDQEWKYPSGEIVSSGHLFEHNYPEVGKPFYVHNNKINFSFRTSPVNKILETTKHGIRFETWNSIYMIKYK